MDNLLLIRNTLKEKNVDAWIIVDYESKNPTVQKFLPDMMLTRKLFLVFEQDRQYIICHSIDEKVLMSKDIDKQFDLYTYNTWNEMLDIEKKVFKYKKVMMDYSDKGLLPRVSFVDYGSMKFILDLGIETATSENLLQVINASYDDESYELQIKACNTLLSIKDEAFTFIKHNILAGKEINEYDVQQFIMNRFAQEDMITDDPPIVAIGKNASNPHYFPTKTLCNKITLNDLVLIDMWAKYNNPKAVYADITWMGFVGKKVPKIYEDRFAILKETIDIDIAFLEKNIPNRIVHGYEVDKLGRDYIISKGYGKYFTHRTGHNISIDVSSHGPGTNIDDYETHDERALINNTSFSLEPGIYATDFGMRSETNIAIRNNKPVCVAGRQNEIIPILK